jgi:hypothetical protein
MVAINRVANHPGSSDDKALADAEQVPLEDLESGGPGRDRSVDSREPGRSDNSLDFSEDDVDHGLLGGRSSRHPFTEDHTQSSSSGWLGRVGALLRGPDPPHKHRIKPFFESLQTAPIRVLKRLLPTTKSKVLALIAFHALWALIFLTVLNWSVVGPEIPGYGMPNRLSCGSRLW